MFNLRHLQALDAVVEEGGFGRAAARLGYAQSTLSQQIALLERDVGGALFDRPGGPRPVRLTPLGVVVHAAGRDVLSAVRSTERAVDRFNAGAGRVDIATFQTVTNVLLPEIVRRLRVEQPRCDIRLHEEETELPRLDGLDLVFFDQPGGDDLDTVLVLADPHVVVARRGRYPAGPVPVTALHRTPVVALPPITDQRQVEDELAARGVAPLVVFRTADNQGVTAMVRAGLGCAVMPLLAVQGAAADPELALHPLTPALPDRHIYLLSRGTLSPLARRVVELTHDVARTVRAQHPWLRAEPAGYVDQRESRSQP